MNARIFFGCVLLVAGCSSSTEDVASDESDIKKRVNPDASTAAFELKKPTWHTEEFGSVFGFDGQSIAVGDRVTRPAGTFELQSAIMNRPRYYGYTLKFPMTMEIPLTRGVLSIYTPAGLVIRYDRPVNAGYNTAQGHRGADLTIVLEHEDLRLQPKGFALELLDGQYSVDTSATEKQTFKLAEGQKKELLLPTATLDFEFETVDAEYPGTATCLKVQARADNPALRANPTPLQVLRGQKYTVPAGSFASLEVDACGETKSLPLAPGAAKTLAVHRLEVNDLDVAVDGEHELVRGTFTLERKQANGSYVPVLKNQRTHTGVDITDGTYRITSTAPNVPPSVQEITF